MNDLLQPETIEPLELPQELDRTVGETLGAAFRQENPVVNLFQAISQPVFKPDPAFDISKAGPKNRFWYDYAYRLGRATSQEELNHISNTIEQEQRDRMTLASQGVGGMLAAMGAGVLSPTTLIPLVGPARGIAGVGQAFALAAAGATADELVLLKTQETRTNTEAGFSIAAGTVLGGLLGSAAVGLRARHVARLEQSLHPIAEPIPEPMVFHPTGTVARTADVELTTQRPTSFLSVSEAAAFRAAPTAAEARKILPPAPEGFVRMYHGGVESEGPRWFSSDPVYARDFRNEDGTKDVWFVDVPRKDLMFNADYADQTVDQGFTVHAEFDPKDYGGIQRLAPSKKADEAILSGQRLSEETGASVGAKATSEQFAPFITELQPDGTIQSILLVDPNEVAELGRMAPATMIGRIAAWISPVLRSIEQPDMPVKSKVARDSMQLLSDAGVAMEGANRGITVGEGTIEARLTYWDAVLARAYRDIHKAYRDYIFEGRTPSHAASLKLRGQIEINQAPRGKLSFQAFQEAITAAMHQGDKSDLPAVQAVAQHLRSTFFAEFEKAAREAEDLHGGRPLYSFIESTEDTSYLHRDWSAVQIAADRLGFIKLVSDYYNRVLTETFQKRAAKLVDKMDKSATLAYVLKTERAEAEATLASIEADLKALQKDRMDTPTELEIDQLRQKRKDLYAEELAKLEEKNVNPSYPETTAANKKFAKEKVKEEQRLLSEKIEELEGTLPEKLVEEKDQIRQLKKLATAIRASIGGLAIKQEKALAQITENEDANIKALGRMVTSINRVMKKLGKVSDEVLDKEIEKLDKQIAALEKTSEKAEQKIIKLEASDLFDPDRAEALTELEEAQLVRERRIDKVNDRLWAKLSFDRDKIRGELEEKLLAIKQHTDRINSRRAVRNERLRTEIKQKYSPEQVEARVEALRRSRDEMEFNFLERVREAGGITNNLRTGEFSFDDVAEELATRIADRITGNSPRLATIDIMEDTALGLRSPMKRRLLDIPYADAAPYLNRNLTEVLAKYANTVGPDTELYRATGDRSGSILLQRVNDDMNRIERHLATREKDETGKAITEKRRTKDLRQLETARRRRAAELNGTLDRIRHLRGVPADPSNVSYRLGKSFIDMNVSTMMGVALLASIPDAARTVMAHGLNTSFKDAWVPYIKSFTNGAEGKLTKQMIEQLDLFGIGTDVLTQRHSKEWFDIRTYNSRQSRVEAGLEYLAHKTPIVALFAPWSDMQKQITGMATMARVLRGVENFSKGTLPLEEVQYLAKIGISPQWALRIAAANRETGTPYKDFFIPNSGEWSDWQALRVFQAAMGRENDRLVITPGLEKPLWMDQHIIGRIVGQFRSFTMATNSKMMIAGLQERNMAAFNAIQGATLSLALGAVSYYAWAMTNGEQSRREMRDASWETWLDQALYRSGLLGAFSEVQGLAAKIPLTRPYVTFSDDDLAGRRADSISGQVLGPSASKVKDIASVLAGIDSPTQSTVNQARKLVPWQNIFFLKEGFRLITEGINEAFNLPERREPQ